MSDKPIREWWLIYEPPYSSWISDKPLHSADTKEEIHVLEAEPVLARIKELEAEIDRLEDIILDIRNESELE